MNILVVDDARDIRLILSVALKSAGYRVTCAVNGQEALALLRASAERPCAILLDLMMPEMNGWEFLAWHQADETLRAIPVIIISAVPPTLDAALGAGARAVLKKPIDLAALRALLAQYCAVNR